MRVFISWSGSKSLAVARALREWMPFVVNELRPYVSSEDIDKGSRWATEIANELDAAAYGILCITADNLNAPWLVFEAGALSRRIEISRVAPFLFDVDRAQVTGPLAQFQFAVQSQDEVRKLMASVNKACGERGLAEGAFDKAFGKWWPDLAKELDRIRAEFKSVPDSPKKAYTLDDVYRVMEEILIHSRNQGQLLAEVKASILRSKGEEILAALNAPIDTNELANDYLKTPRFESLLFKPAKPKISFDQILTALSEVAKLQQKAAARAGQADVKQKSETPDKGGPAKK